MEFKITHKEELVGIYFVDAESEEAALEEFRNQGVNGEIDFSDLEMVDGSDTATAVVVDSVEHPHVKETTAKELAELLFQNRGKDCSVDFYESAISMGNTFRYESAYSIRVLRFADADMVLCNYYGGGLPFCYDFTTDKDSLELWAALSEYFNDIGLGEKVCVKN